MRRTGELVGVRALAAVGTLAVALGGCQAQSSIVPAHVPDPVVVIETASFGEAEIVGHIYTNALMRSGSRVTARPQSGTQDEVVESVVDGDSTFTVGFTGELLRTFDPGSSAVRDEDVYAAMVAALPEGVTAADPAPAEDAPVYVVTRHTSETNGLRAMSDLAGRCGEFTLGARQEALTDRELATAVGGTYDCGFGRRVAMGPNPREVFEALRAGRIGVGLVQSTDPILDPDDMVPLDDDENAIPAQHLVPVFRKGSLSEDQLALVNRISGELTTEDVRELLLGVEFGTATPVELANYWLDSHDY
ncbi:glycine betaine ABC transporter substrate-binding protein [Dietzia sp. PP-33]|jgi:osmoprotectant transport system substrate-binding protein|uniref:glycine betaine ABC transporter substrate-binding protein n=1 Tax=Dietzia sp. PP-33 TaxID=2957500 RepID=UPI0029B7BEC2|nr:glycine betaine ABC transporter substrate-binding protein [Dietzia sp. PP-33]MDX2355756.1 ABC transporter substrate-binding protein [Dietzia sp. PP-33]